MSKEKLDWPGLMFVGLHQLGLSVDEFWALTPSELAIKQGWNGAQGQVLTRSGLSELLRRYPDENGVNDG